MAVPVVNLIKSFDATEGTPFTFDYTGNQPVGMQFAIYRADTFALVYKNIPDSTFLAGGTTPIKLSGVIPPNIGLENGRRYYLRVRVIDVFRKPSDWSFSSYFVCIERPTLSFIGISSGDKIRTQSYTATAVYNQSAGEKIQSYWFSLFDESMNHLYSSKTLYNVEEIEGQVRLSYTYTNFEDDTTYYLRCSCETLQGMTCDSDPIQIIVDYKFYDDFSLLYLSNDFKKGRIEYQANFIIVRPDEYGEDFNFEDSYIHLEDKELNYNQGFNIEDDFILWLRGKIPYTEQTFLVLYNTQHDLSLESVIYDGYMRFKLVVHNGLHDYILYSEPFYEFFDYNEVFTWCIRREGNAYELHVYTLTESVEDVLLSASEPGSSELRKGIVWVDSDDDPLKKVAKEDTYTSSDKPEGIIRPSIWIGGDK